MLTFVHNEEKLRNMKEMSITITWAGLMVQCTQRDALKNCPLFSQKTKIHHQNSLQQTIYH